MRTVALLTFAFACEGIAPSMAYAQAAPSANPVGPPDVAADSKSRSPPSFASDSISLRADQGHEATRARTGLIAGISVTALGVGALATAFVWGLGTAFAHVNGPPDGAAMTGPIATAICGGAGVVGGVVLIVLNAGRVSQSGASTNAVGESPWPRVATWREPAPEQAARPRQAVVGVPLLRLSF